MTDSTPTESTPVLTRDQIVGDLEADIKQGLIAISSPTRAMTGAPGELSITK